MTDSPQPYDPYAPSANRPGPTNGLAIASLVVSIVSVLGCCGLTSVVGAVMGHVARRQIRQRRQSGDGLALAGIIVGWLGVLVLVVTVALLVVLGISESHTS